MARPSQKNRRKDARGDIIADARKLILTNGYDKTSIDTINARVGLSKGTFYHYFKSKSDLLDAVVEELTREGALKTQQAIKNTKGDALSRFIHFLEAARRWRIVALPQTAEIMRVVFRPENALLRERMRDQSIELAAPALVKLLEQGSKEGIFHIRDSAATARVFLVLAYAVSEDQVREVLRSEDSDEAVLERLVARGQAFTRATEALLGLDPDSIDGPDVQLLTSMLNVFRHVGANGNNER